MYVLFVRVCPFFRSLKRVRNLEKVQNYFSLKEAVHIQTWWNERVAIGWIICVTVATNLN